MTLVTITSINKVKIHKVFSLIFFQFEIKVFKILVTVHLKTITELCELH